MKQLMQKISLFTIIALSAITAPLYAETGVWEEAATIAVTAVVAPYTTVKLSTNEITFNVRGEPGEYYSNEEVEVTVGSNQSLWSVSVKASELKLEDSASEVFLSSSRLAFSVDDEDNYRLLEEDRIFLEGTAAQEPTPVKLRFRLTTTWQDAPGTYKGSVTFAFLNNP